MQQIGLVLEGGGLRGLYTSGVLDALLDQQIKIPYVIGVSAGVCNAVSYLSHQKGRSASINIEHCNDPEYYSFRHFLKTGNIFNPDMMFNKMVYELYPFDFETYENSKMTLIAGTTDCETGLPVYYKLDGLKDKMTVIQASSWLPFLSKIVEYDGKKLLDGGISDPIPVKKSIADGNQKNIIVLTQPKGYQKSPSKINALAPIKYHRYPKLVELLKTRHTLYNQTLSYIEKLEQEGTALVFRPSASLGISRLEKDQQKLKAAYQQGYNDVVNQIDQILAFIEK
jgi:predicted patatin/cPLA2 family phospholipase